MTLRPAQLSVVFANLGPVQAHLLMLLYPTVVLAFESRREDAPGAAPGQ
jgi:hypothetical protein